MRAQEGYSRNAERQGERFLNQLAARPRTWGWSQLITALIEVRVVNLVVN